MDCGKLRRIVRCAFAVGVLALAFTASSASAGKLQTGFLDPGALSRGAPFEIPPAVSMPAVQGAGARIVRFYLYWANASPTKPDNIANPNDSNYHWDSGLQANIDRAQSNDLEVMLTIRTAPDWAERGGHSPRGTHNPDPGYLKKFARAAALHYESDVHIWGVWNEPNYKTFLSPQYKRGKLVSPAMYRKLLNAAASSIHAVERGQQGRCRRDRAVLALGQQRQADRARPAALPAQAALRRQVGPFDVQDERARGHLRHPSVHVRQRLPSRVQRERRLLRRPAAVEDADQGRVEGEAHHESKRRSRRRPLDHRVQLGLKPIDPKAVPKDLHARWTAEALYRTWKLGIGTLLWGQLRDYEISTDKFFGQYQSGLYYCDATPTLKDSCPSYQNPSASELDCEALAQGLPLPLRRLRLERAHQDLGPDAGQHPAARSRSRRRSRRHWGLEGRSSAGRGGIFKKTYASRHEDRQAPRDRQSGDQSVDFSLTRPKDRFVNPFGCGGVIPC